MQGPLSSTALAPPKRTPIPTPTLSLYVRSGRTKSRCRCGWAILRVPRRRNDSALLHSNFSKRCRFSHLHPLGRQGGSSTAAGGCHYRRWHDLNAFASVRVRTNRHRPAAGILPQSDGSRNCGLFCEGRQTTPDGPAQAEGQACLRNDSR